MDVPAIGKAKGLFEIFIPGVFLQLNFVWMLYWLHYRYIRDSTQLFSIKENQNLMQLISNQVLLLVILIVFGYLTGVILWLFKADRPDGYSALLHRLKGDKETFYKEKFPYIDSLDSITKEKLPKEAYSFYINCWKPHISDHKNKYFFNYCKTLINSVDEKSAMENYSSEAMIRYLAAMFYAILISLLFLILVLFPLPISGLTGYDQPLEPSIKIYTYAFIIFYLISIFTLLWNFRYMRFKEVQAVFTASLLNNATIRSYLNEDYPIGYI